jgi:transglutaminase-like putative cysteine protease
MLMVAALSAVLALLLDQFVIEARMPGVAGIAALATVMVPVSVTVTGLHLGRGVIVGVAVMAVFWVATPRWTRPRAFGEPITRWLGGRAWQVGAALGTMAAVALAAILSPAAVPGYSTSPLVDALPKVVYFADGPNPLVDLGSDLRDRVAKEALRLTAPGIVPPYLRMTTLSDFDGDTWTHRTSPPLLEQDEDESVLEIPDPTGRVLPGDVSWIEVTGMRSDWVPVPYPASAVTGLTGRFLVEEGDLSIRSAGGSVQGQSYRVTAGYNDPLLGVGAWSAPGTYYEVSVPSGQDSDWGTAPDGQVHLVVPEGPEGGGGTLTFSVPSGSESGIDVNRTPGQGLPGAAQGEEDLPDSVQADLALPDDLPPIIGQIADELTYGMDDPLVAASILENYFALSGGFIYSTSAPSSGGYDGDSAATVAAFLEAKAGYCVHFASAMTLMARHLGIPARIALGYVPANAERELPDGRRVYSVTTKSLHAWPELYLPDLGGWTSFEPTPGRAAGFAPPNDSALPIPTPSSLTNPSPSPSQTPSQRPSPSPRPTPSTSPDDAAPDLRWLAGLAIGLVVLAGAASIPALVRQARRRRRWAVLRRGGSGALAAAWAETRDTARDLGMGAPDTETPRVFGERMAAWFASQGGQNASLASAALSDLVDSVEQAAFADRRTGAPNVEAAGVIVRELGRVVSKRRRTLGVVCPISLVRAVAARRRAAWPPPVDGNY